MYQAISGHREINFTHHGAGGTLRRSVEPARLVGINHRWYVHGCDRDRRDWRTFRMDWISDMVVTENRFVPAPLPTGDLVEAIQASFAGDEDNVASNSDTRLVVLELDADPATAASSLHRIDGALEPTSDGTWTRYTALVDSHEWLLTVLVLSDEAVARTAQRFGRAL